jgi:cytochrome c5
MRFSRVLGLLLLVPLISVSQNKESDEAAAARERWAQSPYGPMLERILPPGFEPRMLPAPRSHGARLVERYCVQCHNLPNPAMHEARKWAPIVDRMVLRMRGRGNMGKLMADMMAGVKAPSDEGAAALVAYLRKYAQKPLDPARYPEAFAPEGEAFRLACRQCHTLPDPKRHTAEEWVAVVARMQRNMEWMNRVVGTQPIPGEPQLDVNEIVKFLTERARAAKR